MLKAIVSKGFVPGNSNYGFYLGQYLKLPGITVKHFTVLKHAEYNNACATVA
jgi:hypothetical protein